MSGTKILHLVSSLSRGGIEMWLLHMLRTVSREDWEMDVCCKANTFGVLAPAVRELGVNILHCPLRPTVVGFVRSLRRILRHGKYDILHIHVNAHSGLAVYAAKTLGVRTITTFHNTVFEPQVRFTKLPFIRQIRMLYAKISLDYAVANSNLVTACSRASLDSVCKHRTPPAGRTFLLYLGTPEPPHLTPQFKSFFRKSLSVSLTDPLVLHVGSFSSQKNHEGLLKVFGRVLQSIPNAHLVLVGEGPLRDSVEKKVKKGRLDYSVSFLGLRDDVLSIMQSCDVLLFPSHFEGLPIVLIEANAAGLPIVASKIPEIEEAFQDGRNAILHDPHDVDGMAECVVKVLINRDFRLSLAKSGRERYSKMFSADAAATRLITLYQKVLE